MTKTVNKLDYLMRVNQRNVNLMKNQTISISDEEYKEFWALSNNMIKYEASAKLAEITSNDASDLMVGLNSTIDLDLPDPEPPLPVGPGLRTNAFSGASGQLTITSHTFNNGVGIIEFNGDIISIGERAFENCSSLTSITIPNSVTTIGDQAFYYCTNLTSITIGNSVTSIGKHAFHECTSLVNINIPNGVTSISEGTFFKCSSLTNCTIGSGVTLIDLLAFAYCTSLTSIKIPSGVTSIGGDAFNQCHNLTSITSFATNAPIIENNSTFRDVKAGGTLTVPRGSSGYDVWMGTSDYYLGKYNWTKVEQ